LPTELGEMLGKARRKKGWSLRDVERETGIRNAHLSQIEQGTIERPDPNILWSLSVLYELDFRRLLRLAGHVEKDFGGHRKSLVGTALHALGDLTPTEQQEVLNYMSQLKRKRIPGGP
jgi:HTH-type transcriptional regulator, competence development regulator